MIRRSIEYVIACDAEHYGHDCRYASFNAFGDRTAAECEASATKAGWLQVSRKRWLCPSCVRELRARAALAEAERVK